MRLRRRDLVHLLAGAGALPIASRYAMPQDDVLSSSSGQRERPLANRLAGYAHRLRYDDLDRPTVERVKTHLIDTIGCAIGAFDERPARICREVALSVAGPATIIGTDQSTTPDLAAFANGAATRFLDFNDTYVGRFAVHPSDNIAACVAVAEAERASVQELITAIAIAYEVNCRLVDALDVSKRGWDPPVFSLPAVALAAGRLMKLDEERLAQAVNLALNDHIPMGQTRVGALSDWKGIAVAEAARNAVFAAMLARAGLSGPAPVFEGRSGFVQLVSGPGEVDIESFGRRGVPFRIHQCSVKPYPAVIYTQTAIVAAIEVANDVGSLDRITAIEIATTRRGYERTGSEPEKWSPKTRETADHSLPYITARAMIDRDITNESFAPEKFGDLAVLAFMKKIKVSEDAALTARGGGAVPTRVTAILSDGNRIVREIDHAPGFAGRPMQRTDIDRKFRGNVGKRWSQSQTDSVLQALWTLEGLEGLPFVLSQLVVQK
jgi:2-methylcitrate dehydratase